MPNKMLIDASHPEETRVVVTRGNRIEEFDFESQDKKQLKGNIYLARVTRVEPSLQAAFVEYGGNRHGFLAFSEIHPDYYQIPVADRQAILKAEAEEAEAEEDDEENGDERGGRDRGRRRRRGGGKARGHASGGSGGESRAADEDASGNEPPDASDAPHEENDDGPAMAAVVDRDKISEPAPAPEEGDDHGGVVDVSRNGEEGEIESVGAEDALEEVRARRKPVRRNYKIQEVVKRRQILLVQVVKEERGNKGAALTTYLSLAGRYSVLMPNTARGGGISRKITSAQDRKRLKEVVRDLDVPQGMGVILRTAGESRTKAEIKRDYEYLMRLWENVRNLTLQSTAPALVYEEGSLIKRSVRDLYNKDIDEIQVAGEEGYREAKDFMRMLMPSHAKVVQPYRDTVPIFARSGIEAQLDRMLQPQVTLKSGGYIIINQTEALVSIDVNSGRSTKEHSIEDTALQTNLEAADEVARQLRLRDLAGLIVIDFIDMEENRNNRSVEKRLKDCLKNDRARIQVGRISHFGLLEMSRQRIRASVLESTMKPCPHCGGAGHVRSDSSVALHVVRSIEEFLLKDNRSHVIVRTSAATALYVLNHKRSTLVDLERRFGLTITLEADDTVGAQLCVITRGAAVERPVPLSEIVPPALAPEPDDEDDAFDDSEEEADDEPQQPREPREQRADLAVADGDGRDRKRRRRRRRRGGRDRDQATPGERTHTAVTGLRDDDADEADGAEPGEEEAVADSGDSGVRAEDPSDSERKKRRRGKRGGKRARREDGMEGEAPPTSDGASPVDAVAEVASVPGQPDMPAEPNAPEPAEKPKRARAPRKAKAGADAPVVADIAEPLASEAAAPETAPAADESAAPAMRQRASRRKAAAEVTESETKSEPALQSATDEPTRQAGEEAKPKKAGWWQRKGFF